MRSFSALTHYQTKREQHANALGRRMDLNALSQRFRWIWQRDQPAQRAALCCSYFPVALVGVSPTSRTIILPTPLGTGPMDWRVFGETPKTAVETTVSPQSNCIVG